jgi:hypothetical protein
MSLLIANMEYYQAAQATASTRAAWSSYQLAKKQLKLLFDSYRRTNQDPLNLLDGPMTIVRRKFLHWSSHEIDNTTIPLLPMHPPFVISHFIECNTAFQSDPIINNAKQAKVDFQNELIKAFFTGKYVEEVVASLPSATPTTVRKIEAWHNKWTMLGMF